MIKQPTSRRYWSQLKALIEQDLAGVTESDLIAYHGQRSKLVDELQEIYGISLSEAEGIVMYYEQQLAVRCSRGFVRAGHISR